MTFNQTDIGLMMFMIIELLIMILLMLLALPTLLQKKHKK